MGTLGLIKNRFNTRAGTARRGWAFQTVLIALLLSILISRESRAEPATRPATPSGDWPKMAPITPRGYVCCRTRTPITIDGVADEPAWADAAWTDDFVDIEGSARPAPRFRTRAKMLWDDSYFYVHAELQEPHVWGTLAEKNSFLFLENAFEIFIGPDGSNHHYYEFEMNPLNTIWELTLDKPYRDGGPAHFGTNLQGLKSAVHVDGTVNNPADTDKGWSVEIAIPWKALTKYTGGVPCPPADGNQWRMDLVRVEWLVDIIDGKYRKIPKEMREPDYWVWSPIGVSDTHKPERWGCVQFSTAKPGAAEFRPDATLPARDRLMDAYYRQVEFRKQTGHYAASARELGLLDDGTPASIHITGTTSGFTAETQVVGAVGKPEGLCIREDSLIFRPQS